ncbi:pyruvate, phosphate dikinase [Rhodococcoides fascians A21d2]|uniref:PEP/pyruvate-binding domain-containing protein n=1 Tax=Rhodococcoides fascians TaxID=1828 RepID=UPI000564AE21|nr:PEP/pyruvate-binding domain-containing protein [Rhodococcus fascians]QIH99904.1 pyruvate, phosphate dikinase [Rhodococcus fascians A21d2]
MLVKLGDATFSSCGGKAHALGILLRANYPVPDGVVVPFHTYRAAAGDRPGVATSLRNDIADWLEGFGDAPLAVRSSADSEDGSAASAAGQHDSVLGVQGIDSIMNAVQSCWTSLHSERAVGYRENLSRIRSASPQQGAMAVIVQQIVDADISGVMFTPSTPGGDTEIEAAWGLGLSVVGGTVTPDRYRIGDDGSIASIIADKRTRTDRRQNTLFTSDVMPSDRTRSTLDDRAAVRLAELGGEIAASLGGPQDIEWSIKEGRVWILQARPITAALPSHHTMSHTATADGRFDSSTILTGTPGSDGHATGTARIVRGPHDFGRVRRGDILVCTYTDPAWTPLLRAAKGVVTETGGVLSHAAIVARELRIPAVLGVANATDRLRDNNIVRIDGQEGTITTT